MIKRYISRLFKGENSVKNRWKTYAGFAILFIAIILLFRDGCQSRRQLKDYKGQVVNFNLKEQVFKVTVDNKNREIIEQNQMILTQAQAIDSGVLENTRLKKIKSQVRVTSTAKIDTIFIPFEEDIKDFDAEGLKDVMIDPGKYLLLPKKFSKINQWYTIRGLVVKEGLKIDSIRVFNVQTITIGDKKLKGLRNIFKRRIPTVEIINENPYISVTGLQNVVITKKKRWYQTTLIKIGAGFVIGALTATQIKN